MAIIPVIAVLVGPRIKRRHAGPITGLVHVNMGTTANLTIDVFFATNWDIQNANAGQKRLRQDLLPKKTSDVVPILICL